MWISVTINGNHFIEETNDLDIELLFFLLNCSYIRKSISTIKNSDGFLVLRCTKKTIMKDLLS